MVINNDGDYSPGRFLAANELKTMLAHVLLNYDIKMANGDQRPSNFRFSALALPDPSAEVLFRKRTWMVRRTLLFEGVVMPVAVIQFELTTKFTVPSPTEHTKEPMIGVYMDNRLQQL